MHQPVENMKIAAWAAKALVTQPAALGFPICFHEKTGSEEPRILIGIFHGIQAQHPDCRVKYLRASDLFEGMATAIKAKDAASWRQELSELNVLLLDDIHDLKTFERTQEELIEILDALTKKGTFAASGHLDPHTMPELNPRLADRLASGLVLELTGPIQGSQALQSAGHSDPKGWTLAPSFMCEDMTFENYVGNELGVRHLQACAESLHRDSKPTLTFIKGGPGLGKTHLLAAFQHHALAYAAQAQAPLPRIEYQKTACFHKACLHAFKNKRMDEFLEGINGLDVLLLDDIQHLKVMKRSQEALVDVSKARPCIVLCGSEEPTPESGYSQAFCQWIQGANRIDLEMPDREAQAGYIRRQALEWKIEEEVVERLTQRAYSSFREMLGALRRCAIEGGIL